MNRHLGRDTLVLQDAHVVLKLSWRIGFDWTGEAESNVAVEPAFPRVCKFRLDENGIKRECCWETNEMNRVGDGYRR